MVGGSGWRPIPPPLSPTDSRAVRKRAPRHGHRLLPCTERHASGGNSRHYGGSAVVEASTLAAGFQGQMTSASAEAGLALREGQAVLASLPQPAAERALRSRGNASKIKNGGPARTRTEDQGIMSPLL